jgi:mono/diheme cytochrome c family protein
VRAGESQLAEFYRGRAVATRAGCLACHHIGGQGSPAPGPDLTHIGSMLPARVIERVLIRPEAPMPSFAHLPGPSFTALVHFLSALRCPGPPRGLMPRGC